MRKLHKLILHSVSLNRHNLTYYSLIKMGCCVFLLFFAIAVLRSFLWQDDTIVEKASFLYFNKGLASGESFLVNYLTKNPEDQDVWVLLVNLRGAFSRSKKEDGGHEFSTSFESTIDNRDGKGIDEAVKPFLSEIEFLDFLDSAKNISPGILRGRFAFLVYGLIEGLKELGDLGDGYEKWLTAGEMYAQSKNYDEAIDHFHNAVEFSPHEEEAKGQLLALLLKEKRFSEIREVLINHPPERPRNYYYWKEVKLAEKDYLGMIPFLIKYSLSSYGMTDTSISLLIGALWFIFFFHLGRGWEWERAEKILALMAIFLGIVSAHFCLILVVIQDSIIGDIRPNDTLFNVIYCICGIGFREELTKLIFVIPLLLWLKNIKRDLTIITLCSFVGLGFAIAENVTYFSHGTSASIISRFMTANFLHMILTGYSGFYLVKAVKFGGHSWEEFGSNLLKMVVVHGIYDLLLLDPNLAGLSIFSMTVFIWLSQLYLRQIINDAAILRRNVSPSRLLTLVISIVVGISYLRAADSVGILFGLQVISSGVMGMFFIGFMFYRELGEVYR